MPTTPDTSLAPSLQPIAAAIISAGAVIVTLLKSKVSKTKTIDVACSCKTEILQSEDRVKQHVDSIYTKIESQLEATHRHANLIPTVKEQIAVLVAITDRQR